MAEKSYADNLIKAFEDAVLDYDNADGATSAPALKHLDRAREDLRQALLVPKQVEEDFPTMRDQFAMAALPALVAADPCSKEAAVRDAYEYADTMIAFRKEPF